MKIKNYYFTKSNFLRITSFTLILLFNFFVVYGQEKNQNNNSSNDDWWSPILQKHNIELKSYNAYENFIEIGSEISIDNKIATIKGAIFIIKKNDHKYDIIKTSLAHHEIEKNYIKGGEGSIETYSFTTQDINAIKAISFISIDVHICEECVWIIDDRGKLITVELL